MGRHSKPEDLEEEKFHDTVDDLISFLVDAQDAEAKGETPLEPAEWREKKEANKIADEARDSDTCGHCGSPKRKGAPDCIEGG